MTNYQLQYTKENSMHKINSTQNTVSQNDVVQTLITVKISSESQMQNTHDIIK